MHAMNENGANSQAKKDYGAHITPSAEAPIAKTKASTMPAEKPSIFFKAPAIKVHNSAINHSKVSNTDIICWR